MTQKSNDFTSNINLNEVFFATKSRGSASGDGSSATYNSTNRRLTLGAFYYNAGFRSGAVGVDKQGHIIVELSKSLYDKKHSALHSTQYFITVVKGSPAIDALTTRKYSVKEVKEGVLILTPNK